MMRQFEGLRSFSLIGALVTTVSLSLNTLLLGYFKTPLIPTYIAVYLLTIGLSFYLNSVFTFKSELKASKFIQYVLVYLSGMALGVALLSMWQYILPLPNWMYPFLVIPFTLIWNFLLSKKLLA